MEQLKDDFTITLDDAKAKIYHLFKFAEKKQNREDPLYGLYGVILDLLASTISMPGGSSLSSFPQSRLISVARELEGLSLAAFRTVIPDFALLLTCIDDLYGTISAIVSLLLEIKPLKPKKDGDPPLHWVSSLAAGKAKGDLLFTLAYHTQLLSQGFCALNAYPNDVINLVFIIGIYFSHFTFKRPAKLNDVPLHKSDSRRMQYIQDNIRTLLPYDCVEVQVVSRCIFDDATEDELRLSNVFLTALRDCLVVVADNCPSATVYTQKYRFFSTTSDDRGGNKGGQDAMAREKRAKQNKKEMVDALKRYYTVEESHLEDASPKESQSCYVQGTIETPYGRVVPSPVYSPFLPSTKLQRDASQPSTPKLTRKRSLSLSRTRSQSPDSQDERPARRRARLDIPKNPFLAAGASAGSVFDRGYESEEDSPSDDDTFLRD